MPDFSFFGGKANENEVSISRQTPTGIYVNPGFFYINDVEFYKYKDLGVAKIPVSFNLNESGIAPDISGILITSCSGWLDVNDNYYTGCEFNSKNLPFFLVANNTLEFPSGIISTSYDISPSNSQYYENNDFKVLNRNSNLEKTTAIIFIESGVYFKDDRGIEKSIILESSAENYGPIGYEENGNKIFIARKDTPEILVIDGNKYELLTKITGFTNCSGIYFSEANQKLYINETTHITEIDYETLEKSKINLNTTVTSSSCYCPTNNSLFFVTTDNQGLKVELDTGRKTLFHISYSEEATSAISTSYNTKTDTIAFIFILHSTEIIASIHSPHTLQFNNYVGYSIIGEPYVAYSVSLIAVENIFIFYYNLENLGSYSYNVYRSDINNYLHSFGDVVTLSNASIQTISTFQDLEIVVGFKSTDPSLPGGYIQRIGLVNDQPDTTNLVQVTSNASSCTFCSVPDPKKDNLWCLYTDDNISTRLAILSKKSGFLEKQVIFNKIDSYSEDLFFYTIITNKNKSVKQWEYPYKTIDYTWTDTPKGASSSGTFQVYFDEVSGIQKPILVFDKTNLNSLDWSAFQVSGSGYTVNTNLYLTYENSPDSIDSLLYSATVPYQSEYTNKYLTFYDIKNKLNPAGISIDNILDWSGSFRRIADLNVFPTTYTPILPGIMATFKITAKDDNGCGFRDLNINTYSNYDKTNLVTTGTTDAYGNVLMSFEVPNTDVLIFEASVSGKYDEGTAGSPSLTDHYLDHINKIFYLK